MELQLLLKPFRLWSYDLNPNHHISTIIVPIIVLTIT